MAEFTIGAYVVGDRWRHDINNDHFGDLSSLMVVTEKYFGPYPPGTPLHYVLDWLVQRIVDLESREKGYGNLNINAYLLGLGDTVETGGTVRGVFAIDGAKWMHIGGLNFTVDADMTKAFTMDAVLRFQGGIYMEAVVV